ncbi:MAG: FecR domain-containing protein [Verrucomicrobiia bacterium]
MKFATTARYIACIAALTFLGSIISGVAQDIKQGKAVVRAITKGTAKYKDPASGVTDWAPLKVDTVLKQGAVIETDATGIVDLFLGVNGPVVRVTPATQLALDKLTFSRAAGEVVIETELDLKAGTILGSVKKLAAASKYEVKTPVGVCGIRGTEYRVSADGRIVVLKGWVRIAFTLTGQPPITIDVKEGQMVIPPTPTTPPQVVTIPENVMIETRTELILSQEYVGAPPEAVTPVTIKVTPIEKTEKDETQNFDSTITPGGSSSGGSPK